MRSMPIISVAKQMGRGHASLGRAAATAHLSTQSSASVARKQRVLSGVQPTGSLHLGNYIGAVHQWVQNQRNYENFFCVVDLHAMTVEHDPAKLRQHSLDCVRFYLAAGIDPNLSTIFIQSHVPAHSELCWLLNCVTPINWLTGMIQFKEKSAALSQQMSASEVSTGTAGDGPSDVFAQAAANSVSVALFDYPVLMAADILLYQADLVPVGEDQRQHLELTRAVYRRFNDKFPLLLPNSANNSSGAPSKPKKPIKGSVFVEPKPLIATTGARVMSLLDGTCKMSKSAPLDNSRINMLDPPKLVESKIKRCKTDSTIGLTWNDPMRPECQNLLTIYQVVTGKSQEDIAKEVESMSFGTFKPLLADAVNAYLQPIQKRYQELERDEAYVKSVLAAGRERANAVANDTLLKVKQAMGLYL